MGKSVSTIEGQAALCTRRLRAAPGRSFAILLAAIAVGAPRLLSPLSLPHGLVIRPCRLSAMCSVNDARLPVADGGAQ